MNQNHNKQRVWQKKRTLPSENTMNNTSQNLFLYLGTSFVLGALSTFFLSRLLATQTVDHYESDSDEEEEEEEETSSTQRYKMVLLVRTDLKMSSGKIAAQCGHATLGAYRRALKKKPKIVERWHTGEAKVALKINSEQEMFEMQKKAQEAGIIWYTVTDAGRTQIASGTKTVLAIGPGCHKCLEY